ncbi:NAD(P)/FAD-dependent oxidoreductase [Pseudonocardia xishanensis]|uniref:NAD(P)/FAD-dependent oxidoreductase n=1 Tax=Pseudonocardia xishanensis TaxID=630995 RepID=A0ABP8S3E5_9PSEU
MNEVDVLIVGAGLSGIGAAHRLQQERPRDTYAILEQRAAIGGTWDLFRYPGVRSDSDMFTLAYPFKPWRGEKSLADGESIRTYIRDTAREAGIDRHIHYDTKVVGADWDSRTQRWTVRTSRGEWRARFVYLCAGYYSYDRGYQPDFPGLADYAGTFVHPQAWPEDLDYTGRRVVVIGSGATAVTLVPAMAETAGHVTMLQRSPSYLTALPARDGLADALRRRLPAGLAHRIVRAKNIAISQGFYQLARRWPKLVRGALRKMALRFLDEKAVDQHFTPSYEPWDQRLCVVPGADFYKSLESGAASVVTDHIDTFTEKGIRLTSGEELEADIVVSATGLRMLPLGGLTLSVDGEPVTLGDTFSYRGLMLSGVPNLAYCIGYTNASWTLRADLSSRYVTRLLTHLEKHGYGSAAPTAPASKERRPLLDLTSGYVQRSIEAFPHQGTSAPWQVQQNYVVDLLQMSRADLARDMTFAPVHSMQEA